MTALPAPLARVLVAVSSSALLTLSVVVGPPATAEPIPDYYPNIPRCHTGTDTDGLYCIESATRDGVEVYLPDGSTDGLFELPVVDIDGAHQVLFGVSLWQVVGGQLSAVGDNPSIEPDHLWQITVNVGSMDLVEMSGTLRDPQLSFGGDPTDGRTVTVSFRPTPAAWWWDDQGPLPCSYADGCGTDDTEATLVYDGFASGTLTDDDGMENWTAAQIERRRGYVNTSNAQEASWHYDAATNAMVVEMANPHLKAPGEPATGFFDVVVPDALLLNEYSVPDPDNLTTGSFVVKRSGSAAPVDFTVTRVTGGVRLKVDDITFSTPRFTIRPKVSTPGAPRWGSVTRPHKRTVKVTFKRPLADGGSPIKAYKVQCARGDSAWTMRLAKVAPAVFPHMTAKPMTCKVRAINGEGLGPWSTPRNG